MSTMRHLWTRLQRAQQRRAAAWIRRRQGSDELPVTLQRRRIYILPTRAGLGFALLLLVMLIAGLNYANSAALLLTFLLAGLALVGMHACHRNLLRVQVVQLGAQPAFAGAASALTLDLAEDGGLQRPGIEVEGAGLTPASCDLPPKGRARLELRLATPLRGLQQLDRVRIATRFPFGLFRAWTWLHVPLAVIVYPHPLGHRALPVAPGDRPGARASGDQADEWQDLRPWREGDSPRHVAWKAYARGAPLLVKEYAVSGSAERQLDFARLAGLDVEARLSQLARWVLDAESLGERYALTLPGARIQAGHGAAHRHRCLAALALHGRGERPHGD